MEPTLNSDDPSDPPGPPRSPEHASWSVEDLPRLSDLPSLGLVGPGQFAEPGVVEAAREGGVGVCRRTGVLVCLVGTPRLAVRPCEVRDNAKVVRASLAKKINRMTGKQIKNPVVQDAAVKALKIVARLHDEVKDEQQALVQSAKTLAEGGTEEAEVAPLAWAGPVDMRFLCSLCPTTTGTRPALVKHVKSHHRGHEAMQLAVSKATIVPKRPMQPAFVPKAKGSYPVYIKVKAAGDNAESLPFMDGLSAEQCDVVARLTNASNAEGAVDGSNSREDEIQKGTGFLDRSGLSKANKKLRWEAGTAYAAARAECSQYEADGVTPEPLHILQQATVKACQEALGKFKDAASPLKAACIWKAHGVAPDAAAEARRANAELDADTVRKYTDVMKDLVTFVTRMIVQEGQGAVASEEVQGWWREDHATVCDAVIRLFTKCQEHSQEMHDVSDIQPAVSDDGPPEGIMSSVHEVLFELLVRPIHLAGDTASVTPLLAFLAAYMAENKRPRASSASGAGSSQYGWNAYSHRATPATAAIIKMATAVSVRYATAPGLSQAERNERVMQVRKFRQDAISMAASAPVAEAATVLRVGRSVLPAEHSGPKVVPCPNHAHSRCAFMGQEEVGCDRIGKVADEAAKMFWNSFRHMLGVDQGAELPAGFHESWIAVPAKDTSAHDDLGDGEHSWMTCMGSNQEEIGRQARHWVTVWAVKELDVAAVEGGEDRVFDVDVGNKKALTRVISDMKSCAQALTVMCTLGTGAPLRATETSSINLRGRASVLRDLYFHDGSFFIIHHRTKASHNVATSGEAQPRRLPAAASAALAAWCRVGLPMRDVLLHCGVSIFGYSQTPSSPGAAASILGLFWASNSPATSCARRVNEALAACGLPLTISKYRQLSAYLLRRVTGEDGATDEDDEYAGIAILAAAAERQFGHSEKTGALYYDTDGKKLTEFARKLPQYDTVSIQWHKAIGLETAGVHQVETVVAQGSSAYAAAGPAAPEFRPILPSKRRAAEGPAGGELHARDPKRRLTAPRGPERLVAKSPPETAYFPPMFVPSPLLLRKIAASVAGVMSTDFQWATKEQEKAAEYVADGMPAGDALLVLPTGGGKTLTYAASCIIDDSRLTVVIVPFVALAHDLHRRFVASGLNVARYRDLPTTALSAGCPGVQVVIAGLEAVVHDNWSQLFEGALACGRRSFIVVEECHVMLFERSYRDVCRQFAGAVRRFASTDDGFKRWRYNLPPMLLVTATAPPRTAENIRSKCGSDVQSAPTQFRSPCTIRPNVRLTVTTAPTGTSPRSTWLISWITQQVVYTLDRRAAFEQQSNAAVAPSRRYVLLVYVETTDLTAELKACLKGSFAEVHSYHAKLSDAEKKVVLDRVTQSPANGGDVAGPAQLGDDATALSNVTAVVGTVGFGVGLDIPDVCTVCIVGHRTASSLIEYSQLAGRAGRDGKPSLCATLLHAGAPGRSFGALPPGGSDSRGLQDGALPNDGAGPTGDFATYCQNVLSCRQGVLHKFLDEAPMRLGEKLYMRSGFGFVPDCNVLQQRFFAGKEFQSCDVCAPEITARASPDGFDSLDDEPVDLGSGMITQDYMDSRVTATLPPYVPTPSGALGLAEEVEMPPLSTFADLAPDVDLVMADIALSYVDAAPPFGEDARSTPETAAVTMPSMPQLEVATTPARISRLPRASTAPAAAAVVRTAPRATTFAQIPAAIAAGGRNLRDFVRKVKEQADTMRRIFPRPESRPDRPLACVTCLSPLVQGAIASTASTSAVQGATAPGSSGLARRGQCKHKRRGCHNCTQNFSDLRARTEFDEHNYKSPQCPLAEERNVKKMRCNVCWLVLKDLGTTHDWGEKCQFVGFRDAAFRMWWERKDLVAVFVAREQARRGAVSQEESAEISESILAFARFLTREHPEHGPPLLHLIAATHAFL